MLYTWKGKGNLKYAGVLYAPGATNIDITDFEALSDAAKAGLVPTVAAQAPQETPRKSRLRDKKVE